MSWNEQNSGEKRECELLGEFGIFMQVALGITSFSSLFLKRHLEYPKRSLRVYLLDVSKQAFSAGWQHVLNIVLAVFLQLKVNKGNGCEWYFINCVFDMSVIVLLSVTIHSIITYVADKYDILILQSGVYLSIHDAQYIYRYSYEELDKHINYKVWFIQLLIWLMIVTIAKIVGFWIEFENAETLIDFSIQFLSVFKGHPDIELVCVMMVIPFILNTIQYWIQDNFLKGTEYIEEQKRMNNNSKNEIKKLHVMKDGMIDFQMNRAQYRKEMGLTERDQESQELSSQIDQKEIEDEFVIVNKSNNKGENPQKQSSSNPNKIRKSHLVRQIEEGILGVKKEDFDENGQLNILNLQMRKSKVGIND